MPSEKAEPTETDGKARAEEDRLAQWREERARVAEEEKQKRIEARRAEVEIEKQAEAEQRSSEVGRLLPDIGTIEAARAKLLARARRARRRLLVQLSLVVLVPTLSAIWYMVQVATPLYQTHAVVTVTRLGGDASADLGPLAGFGGTGRLRETFEANAYLHSSALMDALNEETGLVDLFASEVIDPVQRLRDVPALGLTRHQMFGRFLRSSVDIQTGLITVRGVAPSPDAAMQVTLQAIALTSAHINRLTDDLMKERVAQANVAADEARSTLQRAQADLTQFQVQTGEFDPKSRVEGLFGVINGLMGEAQELRGQIEELEVTGVGSSVKADQLRELEVLLQQRIAEQRKQLVEVDSAVSSSLNTLLVKYELASLDVRIAEQALTLAQQSAEASRREASLSRQMLQVVVPPSQARFATLPDVLRTGLLVMIATLCLLAVFRLLIIPR
jgi:capsular polysaccharide transport system permease protein